eukprot:2315621-Amphidinium_carterae.1
MFHPTIDTAASATLPIPSASLRCSYSCLTVTVLMSVSNVPGQFAALPFATPHSPKDSVAYFVITSTHAI